MTWEEAEQIYSIQNEINCAERILKELERDRVYVSSPKISGMPKGNGGNRDEKEEYIDDTWNLEKDLKKNKKEKAKQMRKFKEFLGTISDSESRTILEMRCLEAKSWNEIAEVIHCARWTASRKYRKIFKKGAQCARKV